MCALLQEVERFIKAHDIAATRFGREAVRDPRFVLDMRKGRTPHAKTTAKVRAFMRARLTQNG